MLRQSTLFGQRSPLPAAVLVSLAVALASEIALVQPADLAAQLAAKGPRPVVVHVGPNVLYRSKHIPGSIYAGPGNKAEGLAMLKGAMANVPHDREVVIYCGCCPWSNCPNIKPAADLLRQMGFAKVKAMYVGSNFAKDWIDRGYPVEH